MEKFLYLNEVAHAATWVCGGVVPLRPASSYWSLERQGSMTPDECSIRDCPTDRDAAWRALGGAFVGATPDNCDVDVTLIGRGATWLRDIYEDGLILCLANTFHIENHANRFPKDACVKIVDVGALKSVLDRELGMQSVMGECEYTAGQNRSPFLKSVEDAWQDEFRIYWPGIREPRSIALPAGLAVEHWRRTTEPRTVREQEHRSAPQAASVDPQRRNRISGITIISPGSLFGFPRDE